jgi:hypothetical protein
LVYFIGEIMGSRKAQACLNNLKRQYCFEDISGALGLAYLATVCAHRDIVYNGDSMSSLLLF